MNSKVRAFDIVAEREVRRLIRASTLTLRAQSIATAIFDHVNEDGEAWCSVRTLAHECRCRVQIVSAVIAKLIAVGFMIKTDKKAGRGGAPIYRMTGRIEDADDRLTVTPIGTTVPGADDTRTVCPDGPNCMPRRPELYAREALTVIPIGTTRGEEGIEGRKGKHSASGDAGACEFAAFWDAYPTKQNKPRAMKAWAKLNPDAQLIAIILQAIAAAKQGDWKRGQYAPHPATWLTDRRWEDELRPAYAAATSSKMGQGLQALEAMKRGKC